METTSAYIILAFLIVAIIFLYYFTFIQKGPVMCSGHACNPEKAPFISNLMQLVSYGDQETHQDNSSGLGGLNSLDNLGDLGGTEVELLAYGGGGT